MKTTFFSKHSLSRTCFGSLQGTQVTKSPMPMPMQNLAPTSSAKQESLGRTGISILQRVYGYLYHEPIEEIPFQEERSMMTLNVPNQPTLNPFILAYPNPAQEYIHFNYVLPENTIAGTIRIFDNIGQLIKSIPLNNQSGISTTRFNTLSNGLYFYTLVVNGTTIAKDKFIINK